MHLKVMMIIALMVLSSTLWADNGPSVMRLSSSGEVVVTPNIVEIDISVETQAPTAEVAAAENAKKMKAVTEKLQQLLDKTGSFKTASYQVDPIYQMDREQRNNVLTGYRVSNQVSVKTMNLVGLGAMLDALMKAGANQIQNLSFSHSENDQLEQQALALAIKRAQEQAAYAAKVAGVKIMKIQEMDLPDSRPSPIFRKNGMMALEAAATTPVTPGELTITKQVSMVFVIG